MPRHLFASHAGEGSHVFPNPMRNLLIVAIGEFCGTFMFLLLSFIGVQTALLTNDGGDQTLPLGPPGLFYIASSFGAALAVNVWIFYRVTGGMFNPAVTLGLVLVRAIDPIRGVTVFSAQILAGIAASAVADGLTPGPVLFANRLGGGATPVQGLFLEMFLTAQLVLTVFFLAVEKHRATFLAPVGIGLSVFVAHICATHWTGTSINPARSFGPEVLVGFAPYHWIYWVGPLLGALLAYAVYALLTFLRYELANPDQDSDGLVVVERGEGPLARSGNDSSQQHVVFPAGGDAHAAMGMPPSPTTKKGHHHRVDSALSETTNFEHV